MTQIHNGQDPPLLFQNPMERYEWYQTFGRSIPDWLKTIPNSKNSGFMQELEGFQYATVLNSNMGYYTIRLDSGSQDICTIITPWGKYKYLPMLMGINCAPDIFQEKMSSLMEGLGYTRTYLNDLLCLSKGDFESHLEHIKNFKIRLRNTNLKVNTSQSSFSKIVIN